MLESTQPVMRVVALVAFTALFAGLWNGDREAWSSQPPPAAMAQWVPHVPREMDNEPKLAGITGKHSEPQLASPVLEMRIGGVTKSFTIDSGDLALTAEMIPQHLAQLPMGIAGGDYRLVDSRGGVGWLHVRIEGETGSGPGTQMVSHVDQMELRYLPVQTAKTPEAAGLLTR